MTHIQVSQETGKVVQYSYLKNFPQFVVIHKVKGFGIVNKAEVDVFLELSCFLDDPMDVGNFISGSSAFSKSSLNIWKLTIHVLLKLGLGNFEHYFASMWDEYDCAVVWAFFGIAFLWDWNENWPRNLKVFYLQDFTERATFKLLLWGKNILGGKCGLPEEKRCVRTLINHGGKAKAIMMKNIINTLLLQIFINNVDVIMMQQ